MMAEIDRAELIAHPERYILRRYDPILDEFIEKPATAIALDKLALLDLRLVHVRKDGE